MKHFFSMFFLVLGLAGYSSPVSGQASLLAENIITDVVVTVPRPDGKSVEDQAFTLVRDASNEDQWYYYPSEPRLAEQVIDGNRIPELSFIKYTYTRDDQTVGANGLLTFAVTIGAQPEALEALTATLRERLERSGKPADGMRLSPIPMNSASALVYDPGNGNLLAGGEANSIVSAPSNDAASNANNKIVFALSLSDVGADVFEGLLNGTGGIPVYIDYKYNGLTPPSGFKVTANWDLAFEHYSKNERFRARASYFGLVSANYESDRQYVREELIKSGSIEVDAITSEQFGIEELNKYLEPIVQRLNAEILEDHKPPARIDPAIAPRPGADGRFGGVGYSVSVKEVKLVRKGSDEIEFRFSSIIERGGRADGVVSLGGYPQDVRDSLYDEIRAGDWSKAVYALPRIPDNADEATLALRLKNGETYLFDSFYVWNEIDGWKTNSGESISGGIEVSLLGVQDFDPEVASWTTRFDVSMGDSTVVAEAENKLSGQNAELFVPSELIRTLIISARGIEFESEADGVPQLFSIDVSLFDGVRKSRFSFSEDGNPDSQQMSWPLPAIRDGYETGVEAEIVFNFLDRNACRVAVLPERFKQLFAGDVVNLKVVAYRECDARI